MAISTVYIYYVANQQLENRQFVLQPSGTLLTTNNNIKNSGDIYQEIHIPYSASNATANMMKIDNKYYDILEVDNTTFKESSTVYKIALSPVSTFLTNGLTINGVWDRTPSEQHYGNKINIANDCMEPGRTISLPTIPAVYSTDKPFYVEITCRTDVSSGSEILNDNIFVYGYFCPVFPTYNIITSAGSGAYHSTATGDPFPSLTAMINDITYYTDIPSDSIISVSISPRCPWKYRRVLRSSYYSQFEILYGSTPITPGLSSNGFGYIRIDGNNASFSEDYTTAQTVLTLSDFERYCGSITIEDERGNDVGEMPTELADSSNNLTYYCYAVSDITGIYTVVQYADKEIILQEGQLPWIGNAWEDYMARNYQYDREMLAENIKNIDNMRNIDVANAAANGIMNTTFAAMMGGMGGGSIGAAAGKAGVGAGAGVASTAINIWASYATAGENKRNSRALQRIREGQVKRSLSNNYQLSQGINYVTTSLKLGGGKLRVDVPANTTSTDFTNYISYQGYPCGKYASFSLAAGYLKGTLYSLPTSPGNGQEMNMLRKDIAEGCRILTS